MRAETEKKHDILTYDMQATSFGKALLRQAYVQYFSANRAKQQPCAVISWCQKDTGV